MFSLICPRRALTNEQKQLNKCIDTLYEKLDILTILEKIEELERIKEIIFSTDQKRLFELGQKPMIKLNETNPMVNVTEYE